MSGGSLNRFVIEHITRLLRQKTGQALFEDRQWRIEAAIQTVLRNRGIGSSEDLVVLLTQPDSEGLQQEVIDALLNNETYFFRDRQVFDYLAANVLPVLAKAREDTRCLRIWSAGCSTGQEPLSLAMLFDEKRSAWAGWQIDIFASDISEQALAMARAGVYSNFEVQRGLAVGQMLTYFAKTESGWLAHDHIKRMVRYERCNLLDGAPRGMRFDLILCRNVMFYLDAPARSRVCRNLADAMEPHAQLLLGGGEVVSGADEPIAAIPGEYALYRRVGSADLALKAENRESACR